jgi:L-threonylcarbamoyladenylate synthase
MEKRTCLIEVSEIKRAAALIRAGELVAFPTETVYGLGANALDPTAVEKIYIAKGRPPGSPLIVHVDSIQMARSLVREWPEKAELLARRFWPGPLTLVLPKQPHVPDRLTAGLDTVGIRVPANPVALALIREAGVPIAAPSANRFTELSPTTAEHVRASMGDRVALVLDGGRTTVGIESTVLSLSGVDAVLLRPGMVTQAEIEAVIGPVRVSRGAVDGAHPSPGMHQRHYSPKTPLLLVEHGRLPSSGRGAYLWIRETARAARLIRMPDDPHAYAALLYDQLHEADAEGWDWIAVEPPPRGPEWAAIHDRLERAAAR